MANVTSARSVRLRSCTRSRAEARLAGRAGQGCHRYELHPAVLTDAQSATHTSSVGVGVDDLVVPDSIVASSDVAHVARGHQVVLGVVPGVAVQVVDHQSVGAGDGGGVPDHLGSAVVAPLRPRTKTVVQDQSVFADDPTRRGQRVIGTPHHGVVGRGLHVIGPSLSVGACLGAVGAIRVLHLAPVASEDRSTSEAGPGFHGLHLIGSEG